VPFLWHNHHDDVVPILPESMGPSAFVSGAGSAVVSVRLPRHGGAVLGRACHADAALPFCEARCPHVVSHEVLSDDARREVLLLSQRR
jgi:hypothetical protein